MLTRPIPKTGEKLPVIGLGTWQTFDVGTSALDRAPQEKALRAFIELGGKVIDTSPMYGRSEDVLGALVDKLKARENLFIATKVWTTGEESGVEQMEESLRKLRVDPIDLIEVHNLVDEDTQLDTLEAWKREGRVRYIGVTHYAKGAHKALAEVIQARSVDFIQVNYSAFEREAEEKLLPLCQELGVAVIVNRPFVTGDGLNRLKSRSIPAWAAEIGCKSWSQILLKYIVSHPAVTSVIPATANVEHLRDNMAAGEGNMPDEALRAKIAAEVS